jgi:hypothetical protein
MGNWNRQAPWGSKSGDLIGYVNYTASGDAAEVGHGENREKIEWRPADIPFEATIEFTGFERGRSAARAAFRIKETGGKAFMFLKDIEDALMAGREIQKTLSGQWVVVKRGSDFGIRIAHLK